MELSDTVADALDTPEGLKRAQALLELAFSDDEDDPAVWAMPSGEEDRVLSPEASARIRAAMEAPVGEPTETMKAAIAHWKLLTGKTSVL